jgi:hypothetical protein
MAKQAKRAKFEVQSVETPEEHNGNWELADPLWANWITANCRSRGDVIQALGRVAPIESSAVMQVVFTDEDGLQYSVELHVGTWYRISRSDRPSPQRTASFGPSDPGLLSWSGEGDSESRGRT